MFMIKELQNSNCHSSCHSSFHSSCHILYRYLAAQFKAGVLSNKLT